MSSHNIVTPGCLRKPAGPLPDFDVMVRRRPALRAAGLALPLAFAALAGCGDDDGSGSDGAAPDRSEAAARGRDLARTRGCAACHGADGQGGIGPAWEDTLGTHVTLTDGSTAVVDEAYLERSITEPDAEVVDGYSVTMPKTNLTEAEVTDLVAYIVALSE